MVISRDPVSGGAPHCPVDGVIGSENRFTLLLTDQWNRKFLMGGGGGYVGSIDNAEEDRQRDRGARHHDLPGIYRAHADHLPVCDYGLDGSSMDRGAPRASSAIARATTLRF